MRLYPPPAPGITRYVVLRFCRNGLYAGTVVMIESYSIQSAISLYGEHLSRIAEPDTCPTPDVGRVSYILEGNRLRFRRSGETDYYEYLIPAKLGVFLDALLDNPEQSALNLN